jgi:hypothetical protein
VTDRPSVERRLLQALGIIGVVAVGGVLSILPYRLYSRDIRHAKVEAHRVASVVHTAIGCPLGSGGDTVDLINRLQGIGDLEILLSKLEPGESHPAATSGRGSSQLDGTDLRHYAPPVLDADGSAWIAEMRFDLSPMKRESVRLIIDLMLTVVIGATVFSVLLFYLVRRSLLVPLHQVTEIIEGLGPGQEVELPDFETREMAELAAAIRKACARRG